MLVTLSKARPFLGLLSTSKKPIAKMVTFSTKLLQAEDMQATGIEIPPAKVAELSDKKGPLVKVTVNGYTYRSKIAPYGERFLIPFAREHREISGIVAGDAITVELELD